MYRDRRPAAEVDTVAVLQRHLDVGRDLAAVDERAVGRAGIQDRPVAVGGGDQHRVQPTDARVGRRAGQVDLRLDAARYAAPPDPHLAAGEPELPLSVVTGKRDSR